MIAKTTPNISSRFIPLLTDKFIELHGDRTQGDDKSVCGGLAWIEGKKIILISHNVLANDNPETTIKRTGLRKITRLLNIAKQLKRPVLITKCEFQRTKQPKEVLTFNLIDAITQNLRIMSHLPVPIILVLSGNPTIVDSIAPAIADCIIANHDFGAIIRRMLNSVSEKPELFRISELMDTIFIDDTQIIPALRRALPSKIDELMSIPVDDLTSRRIIRIQKLSHPF